MYVQQMSKAESEVKSESEILKPDGPRRVLRLLLKSRGETSNVSISFGFSEPQATVEKRNVREPLTIQTGSLKQ